MTITWGWIQGTAGDIPAYTAQNDRQVLAALHDEGVVRGCKATAGDPARTVIIGTGQFAITGDDQPMQGLYIGTVTVAETVAIAAAPASGTRQDLVYLKVQDLGAGGPAGNDIVPLVVQGTVGGGVPALPASGIAICSVSMTAGQSSVTTAQITDQRVFAETKSAVGTIKLWYGPPTRIPVGWRCLTVVGTPQTIGAFGSFPDLADLLGVTSGNITVADVRGRAMVAVNPADGTLDVVGDLTGASTSVIAAGHLPAHSHTIDHDHPTVTTGFVSNDHSHAVSLTSGGSSQEVVQRLPSYTGNYIAGLDSNNDGTIDNTTNSNGMAVQNGGTGHTHVVSGNTGGISANHTHSVDLPMTSGLNSGNGPGSSTGLPIIQPSAALHVLIRVL